MEQAIEYKGYVILPIVAEEGGKFFGGYEITKSGKVVRIRRHLFPGVFYRDASVAGSVEHARLEIDGLPREGS